MDKCKLSPFSSSNSLNSLGAWRLHLWFAERQLFWEVSREMVPVPSQDVGIMDRTRQCQWYLNGSCHSPDLSIRTALCAFQILWCARQEAAAGGSPKAAPVKAAFWPTHTYIPHGHISSQAPTLHRARGFLPPSLQAALLTAGMG